MPRPNLTYSQILETNNIMRAAGEETYYLGVTRTVQESKFFPVSAYVMLGYLNAFYRYPALLRKIESHMSPEDIADRIRNWERGSAMGPPGTTTRRHACEVAHLPCTSTSSSRPSWMSTQRSTTRSSSFCASSSCSGLSRERAV